MSVYSQRSSTSKRSNRIAKDSQVDETLFGGKKPNTANGDRKKQEEIQKLTAEVRNGEVTNPNAIIISQTELQRMKNCAVVTTKEEQLHQKRILEEQNEKQQAAAKAKKQRMLEIEAERRKNIPPSETEIEEKIKNETLQTRAQQLLNEQKDEVKHMNQMTLYAKTVTIRDKQVQEKKEIHDQKKLEEKRKDLMMEVERLKKIKYYEELERQKKEEQKQKALLVVDQIKERELERLREQEEREREGQEMIKAIKQLQADEATATIRKKQQQKNMNDEIYHENQRAIGSKQKKIQQEKEEEEKIVQYNVEKAQKEAEYQAEQKRIKDEKEREVQRLREMQEKAQDRQAEIDALRAKRAVEAAERQARERERREAEMRAKMDQELFDARKLQSLEKEGRLQEQARQDRDEFQTIIQKQKMERDLELKQEQERKGMIKGHADQLKKQIALNEEKKKQDKRSYLEEGKKIKDKLAAEKRLLENIKEEKLHDLKTLGIPDKYQAELTKKKIIV
jgi:hypothetical protein